MVDAADRIFGDLSSTAFKAPTRVATTAPITLYGVQTIDTVAVVVNDRVLVKDQTDSTQNGIYLVQSTDWVRAPDFDGSRDVIQGTLVSVYGGNINEKSIWTVTTANPISIASTAPSNITFAAFSGYGNAFVGTSSTSHPISTGSLSFQTQAGKAFGLGYVTISSDANPSANNMEGIVTAYDENTGALTANITIANGSGTHSDWVLNVSGPQGSTGATGATGAPGGPLADGDYGDIVVSATGSHMVVDSAVITEAKQILADNTTNNASTSMHGYLKKLSGSSTDYMGGDGNWNSFSPGTGRLLAVQIFTSSGTYSKTAGTNSIEVELVGGGAAGSQTSGVNGTNGGDTSFGAHCTAGGGKAGLGGSSVGGTASGGDINIDGQSATPISTGFERGGDSPKGFGFGGNAYGSTAEGGYNYGGGGASSGSGGGPSSGPGGGGAYVFKRLTSGIGATEAVTIGAGGTIGFGSTLFGAPGILIVREYS